MTALQSAIRSAIQPAIRSAFAGSYGWLPTSLFAAGEQGVWYDPSDLSTMFQDVAGTVPVTADGQLVARINDKSGKGNHATQATEASRPLYKTSGGLHWLQFDGVNDSLATAAIDFLGSDKISLFTAAYKASDVARTAICALGGATQGFRLYGSHPAGNANIVWESGGSVVTGIASSNAAPVTRVLTGLCNISGDSSTLRVNGASTSSAADRGTGVYSTAAITVGARGAADLPLNGYVYGLIVRNVLSVAAEITAAESYMAAKSGVTLP